MTDLPQEHKNYLPVPVKLDPILEGVKKTFRLEEEFRVFLDRNENIKDSRPDVGFLLFLIEQQREAIINMEMRIKRLETGTPVHYQDRPSYKSLTTDKDQGEPNGAF